ncbi:MAG: hypothetical protein IJ195_09015 [Lachnospiraceae bacterium]|nr:hypothetical protein [Lachnospiraceae bacterium]
MAILNKEMKPGVKCYVEGFVEAGGDRFYVRSKGIVVETPDVLDSAVDVLVEKGHHGKHELVTAKIENCYWISQKTRLSVKFPEADRGEKA